MTPPPRQTRGWVVAAAVLAQIAAARAGMLPWWLVPATAVMTIVVPAQTAPADDRRSRTARGLAVAAVAGFTIFIALRAVTDGRGGGDPLGTMRLLTEALVVLSLAMAPTWRTARDYRVWLSVTTGVLVAATVGSQRLSSDLLLILAWVFVLTALVAVARGDLADAATVASPQPAAASPGPGALAAPVLAALTAGGLVFLVLPGGIGGGDLAAHLAHAVHPAPAGAGLSRAEVGVDTVGNGDLDLLVRGQLPNTPLLRVPADSPPLWRGSIYTTYTGQSWLADPNQPFRFEPGDDPTVPSSAIDPVPAGTTQRDRVEFAPGTSDSLVWAPGVPLQISGIGGEIHGIARGPANLRIIGASQVTGYTVTSAIASTAPDQLAAAAGPQGGNSRWTALPPELPASVSALAHRITATAPTRYAEVTDLEAYLRTHETYTLNSPVPGPGEDAVADFLFRDHTGFCEQFASAEAVMLRTLGVPARVVSGLAYGTRQRGTRLLTAADAHAWVEVYYPGVGWSPTDPTAGTSLAPGPSTSRSTIATVVRRIDAALPGGRVGLFALLAGAVLAAAMLGRALRRHTGRAPVRRSQVGPVLAAFHRFARRHRRAFTRDQDETAREFLSRVGGSARVESAVVTLEQECYGATAPGPAETADAVAGFDAERHEPAGTASSGTRT